MCNRSAAAVIILSWEGVASGASAQSQVRRRLGRQGQFNRHVQAPTQGAIKHRRVRVLLGPTRGEHIKWRARRSRVHQVAGTAHLSAGARVLLATAGWNDLAWVVQPAGRRTQDTRSEAGYANKGKTSGGCSYWRAAGHGQSITQPPTPRCRERPEGHTMVPPTERASAYRSRWACSKGACVEETGHCHNQPTGY